MSGELERLLVRIEADTTLLRRELANADKATAGFSSKVERQLGSVEKRFAGFGATLAKSFAGLGVVLGGASIGRLAGEALGAASKLGELSASASLTTDAFQELGFAMQTAGIQREDWSRGANTFARNMAELRANQGGFNIFLQQSLPTLREQLLLTKNQEDAYGVLADAMSGLSQEQDRTLLANKAMGETGEKLVGTLSKGSAALRDFGSSARQSGAIVSAETIKSLSDARVQYEEFSAKLSGEWVNAVGAFWQFHKEQIEDQQIRLRQYGTLWEQIFGRSPESINKTLRGPMFEDTSNRAGDFPNKLKPVTDNSGRDALSSLHTQMLGSVPGRDREAAYAQMDQELQKFRDMLNEKKISAAEFETARADLNAIAGAKISASISQENQKYRDQFRELEGLISGAFDDVLTQSIKNGNVEWKTLAKDMLADLAKMTVKALILAPLMNSISGGGGGMAAGGMGGGGLLGMLPMLFGGARASGGPVSNGKSYLVGENGPELFSPGSSGNIIPNGGMSGPELPAARGGASAGGSNVYNFHTTVDARGADMGVMQRMSAVMDARDRAQQRQFEASQREQNRFPTRGASMATAPPASMRRLR